MRDGWKNQSILTAAAIAVALLLMLVPAHHANSQAQDSSETAQGRAYVEAEAQRDTAEIMNTINVANQTVGSGEESQGSEGQIVDGTSEGTSESGTSTVDITSLQAQIDSLNINQLTPEQIADYKGRLSNVQFVGDSMTQAAYDYGLLDADHVWFVRGASIGQLSEQIQSAIDMLPESIVFFTGANAVDYYESADVFAEAYKNQCDNILAQRPDMNIYICSMLPVSDDVASYREDLAKTGEYDQALQQICAENGFNYIDLNWMVKQELYIEDGLHFDYDFYQIWIQYIASKLASVSCLGL